MALVVPSSLYARGLSYPEGLSQDIKTTSFPGARIASRRILQFFGNGKCEKGNIQITYLTST